MPLATDPHFNGNTGLEGKLDRPEKWTYDTAKEWAEDEGNGEDPFPLP